MNGIAVFDSFCGLPNEQKYMIALGLVLIWEHWLSSTDKVKAGSTLGLIMNGLTAAVQKPWIGQPQKDEEKDNGPKAL